MCMCFRGGTLKGAMILVLLHFSDIFYGYYQIDWSKNHIEAILYHIITKQISTTIFFLMPIKQLEKGNFVSL